MNIKKDIVWRIYLSSILVLLLGGAILAKAIHTQWVEGDYWKSMADSMSTKYQTIEANRGNIYAIDGSLLATSLPVYEVRFDPMASGLDDETFDEGVDSLAQLLATEFKEKTATDWKRKLINARKKKERYVLIQRKLSFETLKKMRSWPLFRMGKYKGGFIAIERTRRFMPFQNLAQRTIGFTNEEGRRVGLEGAFDDYLAGQSGKRLMQKVSGGDWIPVNDDNEIEPQDGNDVISTIDINLQDVAEEALLRALKNNNAHHGCAVLMEVKTGEIRAIANLTYKGEDNYAEDFNWAVGAATEPGSTFKLVSALALLEDKLVNNTDSLSTGNGEYKYADRTMRDSEPGGHGWVNLHKAFMYSSNVGISRFVTKHYSKQPQAFVDHINKLKLNEPLGLQLKGEGSTRIKQTKDKDWYGTTLPWMSIGYELLITPLQTLTLYNAVANGGTMVKPLFVKRIEATGKPVQSFETTVLVPSICSDVTLVQLRKMMEDVVEKGTARNLRNPNYKIAGKTGTAQIANRNGGYEKTHQASFVGYFPANNPQYTCIVVISEPKNGIYYGSLVAGPVFKEIADKVYATSLNMHPSLENELADPEQAIPYVAEGFRKDIKTVLDKLAISNGGNIDEKVEWVYARKHDNSMKYLEKRVIENLVPDVTGMGLKDAFYLLESAGLKVNTRGAGKVRTQSLKPGTRLIKGSTITLQLS